MTDEGTEYVGKLELKVVDCVFKVPGGISWKGLGWSVTAAGTTLPFGEGTAK